MNKILWLLVATLSLAIALPLSAETLTIVADEWCPYNCEPGGDTPGFGIEAATQIFGAADIQVEYVLMDDWDQSIEKAREGKYNAIIGANKGDAPDFIFPSEALANPSYCFFVRKDDSWTYQGPDSLKERQIAVIEAYDYGCKEIAENTFGNVTRLESLETGVEALLGGKVDTFLEDEYVFQLFEYKNHIAGETREAGNLEADQAYIAFSPAHPRSAEFAEILSKGIAAMKSSGEWKALLQKYGIAP